MEYRKLEGTQPVHSEIAAPMGSVPDDERMEVILVLQAGEGLKERLGRSIDFAQRCGLEVVEASDARHDMVLEGSVAKLSAAFRVDLEHFDHPEGSYRSHRGEVHLPSDLHGMVIGVLGLDEGPKHRATAAPAEARAGTRHTPKQVSAYYHFPAGATGRGQRIAILSFGGGYYASDLVDYFKTVLKRSAPAVQDVSVGGRENQPLEKRALAKVVTDLNDPTAKAWHDDEFKERLKNSPVHPPASPSGAQSAISSAVWAS